MRDAVVEELLAVTHETVLAVHVLQIRLGVDVARVVPDLGQRGLHQPRDVPLAACAAFGAHPADTEHLLAAGMLLHEAQRGDHLAVGPLKPEVPGLGEQVASVQFRVRRGLFDDEHLDAQLEQLVKRWRIEVFGPAAAQ